MTQFLIRRFIRHPNDPQDPATRTAYGNLASGVGMACNLLLCLGKMLRRCVHLLRRFLRLLTREREGFFLLMQQPPFFSSAFLASAGSLSNFFLFMAMVNSENPNGEFVVT